MSVVLTSYPVTTSSGKVRNIFAGFAPVELEFKREDVQIVDVSQGIDNKILISITGNITGNLNIGEWIYLYSVGTTYTYNDSFQITSLVFSSPNTEITVEGDFIEVATGGYCNYRQNWFLEAKLVNQKNNDILVYPQLLQNDGSPSGIVEVNTSMLVDFLNNEILSSSGEVTNARQDCKVMYRESWREDDSATFTLIDQEPIIIIYAAEDSEINNFVNGFENPRIYEGYPFFLNILGSIESLEEKRISVLFDELNINKTSITSANSVADFEFTDFGIMQINFNDNNKVIEDETRYIVFNGYSVTNPNYLTGEYHDTDYLTINTP